MSRRQKSYKKVCPGHNGLGLGFITHSGISLAIAKFHQTSTFSAIQLQKKISCDTSTT